MNLKRLILKTVTFNLYNSSLLTKFFKCKKWKISNLYFLKLKIFNDFNTNSPLVIVTQTCIDTHTHTHTYIVGIQMQYHNVLIQIFHTLLGTLVLFLFRTDLQ